MCIAIIKPGSAPLPTLEQLQNCAKTNRDGGGLCYPTVDGQIQILKGFKDAESMFAFLQTQDFSNTPMMIHFRIGTHGAKSAAKHTHPFPVGATTEEMEQTNFMADMALMHNGIMYKFGYDKDISDTMAFARDALPNILEMPEACRNIVLGEVLGTSNKIALMAANGEITRFGSWTEDGGLFWSNSSYKSYTAAADPRAWGTQYCTGGKYKNSSAQTDFDDDWRYNFQSRKKKSKAVLIAPTEGQFWSEVIEKEPIDFDIDLLREEFFKIVRLRSRSIPYLMEKPADMTNADWDTVISYRYSFMYVKEEEWEDYIENKRVLPGEFEVEAAVSSAIEAAATDPAEQPAPLFGDHEFVE